jgi:uncharacterized protein YlxW (UPF0749 family)
MMKRWVFTIVLSLLVVSVFVSVAYGQAGNNASTDDILIELEKIKIQLNSLENLVHKLESNQASFENRIDNINIEKIQESNALRNLVNETDEKYQSIVDKYDTRLGILGFWQNALNTIMVFGGLVIAFWGISSVSDYRKTIIKDKIDESMKEDILNKALARLESDIKEKLFNKFSGELNTLSSRVEKMEQFEPVLKVLEELKKNG